MKDRQRWTSEEDAILRAYVKQYGPREWNLVSERMNVSIHRDAKSCLERWKNYLKPGIKKGSLTEDEQCLVIHLQAKHGNKWKKIAAEVPGRTAKRLAKWWEVFKEKQQREQKESTSSLEPIEEGKYDRILETFAQKLVNQRQTPQFVMATSSNGAFLHSAPPTPPTPTLLPPWLSTSNGLPTNTRPPSPSVTLTLSPSTVDPVPTIPWLHPERGLNNCSLHPSHGRDNQIVNELVEYCRELEEGHRVWAEHKKEAEWRVRRMELQLESEKVSKRREKMEDTESRIRALREEEKVILERIDYEYKEQLTALRRDAEAKEQKLAEQWFAKHMRLTKFLEQRSCVSIPNEPNF
ncbi:hypothetical protein MKW98_008544 [Papaver atlanticum]|uniref:Uncharacterized protein n=1 Tax=Papaver atlanticum TaxID=357466 RepID=A0AAD4XUN7_9MAGN|nr:hypothetical protein MKW98_008544 [Papaver atlanticum]